MSILQILNEIAADSSTKAKEAILLREKDNAVLKQVFQAAYHPMISYYIKKIPSVNEYIGGHNLSAAIKCLDNLSSRKYTGNAAITELEAILSLCNEDDAIVLARIVDRDLRCGCSDSIASRVWPGLVPTFDVMLSHKDISGIKFPAYAQLKCLSGDWEVESDSGEKFKIKDVVEQRLELNIKSYDTENSKVCFMPIMRWLNNGNKRKLSVITYKDETGRILKSQPLTADHEIWLESSRTWVQVSELRAGDVLL